MDNLQQCVRLHEACAHRGKDYDGKQQPGQAGWRKRKRRSGKQCNRPNYGYFHPDTADRFTNAAKELVFPVGDKIVKEYSGDTPVYSKTFKDWRLHKGTDYAAGKGNSVKSIDDGTVFEIKKDSTLGTIISVEHNSGFVAYYCGVKAGENIKEGTHLSAGDVLGTIDQIPGESKDEAHLHLEIKVDGKNVNPAEILNKKADA